jgi:DNA-binding CsgD family transcriptional regulator
MNKLTERQWQVLELKSWGASNKIIGAILRVATPTVVNHLRAIYDSIGAHNAAEAAAWFFCNKYGISDSLNPLKKHTFRKGVLLSFLLISLIPSIARAGKSRVRITDMKRSTYVNMRVVVKTGRK